MSARPLLVWYAFLGGPLAWGVHIGARYPLVPMVCKEGAMWLLHSITAACLLLTLGAGVAAGIVHQSRTAKGPRRSNPQSARLRFMVQGGLLLTVLFGVVIVLELVPALLQDPCIGVRTG